MAETLAANTTEAQELPVTFHPALFLQRRKWVFEVMRRENVTSVVDIGCGEGETIECLCNAAPWRAPPEDADPQAKADAKQDMLYVRKIHALDVSRGELELAKAATAPRTAGAWQSNTRWEPLEVHLWEGGLEAYNAEFVDAECMISTEVVEHLPEDILPEFAPMLLGVYHPRLLLITTPSYDFNARFTAPDAPPGTRKGYPDPTGRTGRIFRHPDHKFEWTVEEFRRWCTEVAEEWGYDVDMSGVGRALEKDEWGRDEELGFASQVAAFSRRPGEDLERMREAKSAVTLRNAQSRQAHRIFATHRHTEHERSGKPTSMHDIQSLVKGKMQSSREAKLPVHYLWYDIDVSESCGGWLHLLLQAVEQDPELTLHRQANERNTEWVIEFLGLTMEEQTHPQTEAQTENIPRGWGAQTNVWSSWTSVDSVDSSGSDWVSDHAESWGMSSGEVWNEGWGTVPLEPGRAW